MTDDQFMALALAEAEAAGARGEVPVGAVLVSAAGEAIARDGNRIVERHDPTAQAEHLRVRRRIVERHDPTAHAEMLCLRAGAAALGNERLTGTTLYVTLEPCAMCAGAASLARVSRIVFAADDPKGGAVLHGARFFEQPTCHHRPQVARAGDAEAVSRLLKGFFQARR